MCVLQYHIVYVAEDKDWNEALITVDGDTFEAARLKYIEALHKLCKAIRVSELVRIENNKRVNTEDLAQ